MDVHSAAGWFEAGDCLLFVVSCLAGVWWLVTMSDTRGWLVRFVCDGVPEA